MYIAVFMSDGTAFLCFNGMLISHDWNDVRDRLSTELMYEREFRGGAFTTYYTLFEAGRQLALLGY